MKAIKTLHPYIFIFSFGLVFSLALPLTVLAQSSWTIEQLQDSAEQNYPLIQQYDLINQAKEFQVSNLSKNFLPQFDVTLIGGIVSGMPSFSPGESSSTSANLISVLQVNQAVWDGGITKANKNMVEINANVQAAEVAVSTYNIRQKVNDLFFGILLIDEQMTQLRLVEENLNTNLKRAKAGVENGVAYKSDLEEIKVELLNTDQKITELTYAQRSFLAMLSAMVGHEIDENASFVRPEVSIPSTASLNRPELSVFMHQRNLLESRSQIDKALHYPKIGLLGFGTFIQPGVEFGSGQLDHILVGGISVSWNIASLYKNKNNQQLNEIDFNRIRVQEETFLYQTNLQLSQTQKEIEKYQALLARDQELIELKKSIRASYETKYENGVTTMSQLLTRINDENLAQQNLNTHEVQYLMAVYKLKTETGN